MPETDAAKALEIARQVHELAGTISDRLAEVDQHGKRTRRLSRIAAAAVVVDVLLTVTLGWVAVRQNSQQNAIHQSQLHACAIGNEFRAGQRHLWDHVIAVSQAPPHETAAERKIRLARIAAFRVYVRRQFTPVNCRKLYPG